MQLAHWNPLREMEDLLSRFGGSFGRPLATPDAARAAVADWVPAVDTSETAREYVVRAELPGLKKDDIKVAVNNGVLTLSGERKTETRDDAEKPHRIERFHGQFQRSFALPEDALAEGISAECRDGVLTVHIARSEAPRPKSIEVKVA